MRGMVTKNFAERAFGFIRPDGSRSDVFFHKSAMAGGTEPQVDMVVEFVEEPAIWQAACGSREADPGLFTLS